jgi:hypothetical protein
VTGGNRESDAAQLRTAVTLLVNSCDSFADCWDPFFTLLSHYWRAPLPRVLLNTELRAWTHDRVPVVTTAVQSGEHKLTWSECLLRAIALVETPLILYTQEDYFLEAPVRTDVVERCVSCMIADPSIAHIGLTDIGSSGPFEPTEDESLWRIPNHKRYRISLQAGLWRPEALRKYLRPHENAWMFEIFGTRRAWRVNDTFLTVSRELYSQPSSAVFSYAHTGIIKGQWNPKIQPLFAKHRIAVDFERRGFHAQAPRWRGKLQTIGRLLRSPADLLRSL